MLRNLIRYRRKGNFAINFASIQPSNNYASKEDDNKELKEPKRVDKGLKEPSWAGKDLRGPSWVGKELTEPQWVEHEYEPEIGKDPIGRMTRSLRNEFRGYKNRLLFWKDGKTQENEDVEWGTEDRIFPEHVDVLIVGGGGMGSSIAYWLKQRAEEGLRIVVVERDPTYRTASTALSAGGLRQQFSLEENIEMSLFGAEFLRNANEYLEVPGLPPIDVQFQPHGYLFLASEASAEQLHKNSKLQNSLGAKNVMLTATQVKNRFPWINTDGIACGCLGLEKEGWFDPWALLYGFKRKALSMGVAYVKAEMVGFTWMNQSNMMISDTFVSDRRGLSGAVIITPDGEKRHIRFAICVVAAGAHSAEIARMANVGTGPGVFTVPLPVEPRKRYAFCFHSPDGPGINTPLTIDPTGTYFRREGLGGHYIAGRSPTFEEEPSCDNLDVDDGFFERSVWPAIAHRVKSFENLKLKSSWAGFYEYNTFDANGVIGPHPELHNLYFATGFSGHGIQQAAAVGRAITELIIDSNFITIDLTRLGFDRFITLEPMKEVNIV